MFEKRDRVFEEALADADKLDRRLGQLRLSRKMMAVMAAVAAVLFFVLLFMSIRMSTDSKSPVVLPVTPLVLFMAAHQALMASLAHGEIRTLLAFKKLREISSPL